MVDEPGLNGPEAAAEEDAEELAQNLAMYTQPYKDPLVDKTVETALERTPIFDETVRRRGYDPLKDQWSPLMQRLQFGTIPRQQDDWNAFQRPRRRHRRP